MNKKKKSLKIIAAVFAFSLIGILLFFAAALLGNPISYLIVKNSAENFLEEKFAGTDYQIENISYFFKDTSYTVSIVSPSSIDGDFSMSFDYFGKFKEDDYVYRVTEKRNTEDRINREYMQKVTSVLESEAFPFDTRFGAGYINFPDRIGLFTTDAEEIPKEELELNKIYDLKSLGERAGVITLQVWDDEVTVEKTAEILKTAKQMLDAADIGFNTVVFTLYPNKTDDNGMRGEGIGLNGFSASDIDSPDIIEKINEHIKNTFLY